MDPLQTLPAEIVLRIIDFSPISSVASLTRLSRTWHDFIDNTHQATIYSSHSKTAHPQGSRDLSFLADTPTFTKYYEGTSSWKDLCKRQALLSWNWSASEPTTRESVIQIGNDAIWRFRPDFKRRMILSTSQQGGFNVTDMDTGSLLWQLSNATVKPFAHLEYEDGIAVWDCEGNGLQVWKLAGWQRRLPGAFQETAFLKHDCQIRGFQLSGGTLCVVSDEGKAFVYDMNDGDPQLRIRVEIERGAVGHLYQDADVMMVSMGDKGFYFYDKTSGAFLGALNPGKRSVEEYHIRHPTLPPNSIVSTGEALSSLPSVEVFPPRNPTKDRLFPIQIRRGPLPRTESRADITLEADDWGAGVLCGSLMVGISRGGRVFICTDWRSALQDPKSLQINSSLVECESDGANFDYGGWLSVHDNRLMFEIQDLIYVVTLADDGTVPTSTTISPQKARPSFAFNMSSATQLATPVSFMALFDDCIMLTYTTLGWIRRTDGALSTRQDRFRIFPTKTIRVLSLAPSFEESTNGINDSRAATPKERVVATRSTLLNEYHGYA